MAAARREFLAQIVYYNNEEANLGGRFSAEVEEATALAVAFPLAGSPATKNTRRVFLDKFPFSVVYRPMDKGILVFAVAHDSRKPGYWKSRVSDRYSVGAP